MNPQYDCSKLTNQELVIKLKILASDERKAQAAFLAHLTEVDSRRVYAELGYSSLFKYCLEELHLSEGSTCKRIQVARTAKEFPVIYSLIEEGKIHLEGVSLLSPLLNGENHEVLLKKACHKTKREVEQLVAGLAPQEDAPDFIRKLPQPSQTTFAGECRSDNTKSPGIIVPKPRPETIKPITEESVVFKFTGSAELRKKLEKARQILRHKHPHGKLEDIINEALESFLEKRDPERRIARKKQHDPLQKGRATSSSRRIPQRIKDQVWVRDRGRCQYTSQDGKQCGEKAWLEFDHIQPWVLGGVSDDTENIRLLCRTHNQWRAKNGGQ
ncbi:MAG: HNH endonuclease [Deltaproteobacteria bacterium]|nr:HNH endonuclease [Deltaproteobacteria bacterium]MBI4224533.1 HNH endonuclease [Deltaproteobacteria bacterium]